MPNGVGVFTITIRKRPWWLWTLAGFLLLLEVLLLQTAVASVQEGEERAAAICLITVTVAGAFSCFAWLRGRRPYQRCETDAQRQELSTPAQGSA
jgi:uncharacterized membrane-anchored protein